MAPQRTLVRPCTLEGVGLHQGLPVHCQLQPACPGQGYVFVRTDLNPPVEIAARLDNLTVSSLSTQLQCGDVCIQTVEHCLAALSGLGIDNCIIAVDGPELPILDGSARPYVLALLENGVQEQDQPRVVARLDQPLTVWEGEAFVAAVPSPEARFSYAIDFVDSPIGQQWYSWVWSETSFRQDIAPARTFTRLQDVERARQHGLIKGGSLENAIVCTESDWLTPLRFENEPVRHKLLDLLGDLSLLGFQVRAHILAHKAGHALHHRFSQSLMQSQFLCRSDLS
ncbi:MAG: UDP-3-O-[3-hydroxymyristoyl] N-acetylglucosamine deacetylase [Synechococcaceae cyanobacterium SM2_3_1]|nr:UDP-3-O-[3-hydroxymyristoyl] N-acetylglucosamine deacetylase [Synechococcaceae cyanobacterium SM2_3_1]